MIFVKEFERVKQTYIMSTSESSKNVMISTENDTSINDRIEMLLTKMLANSESLTKKEKEKDEWGYVLDEEDDDEDDNEDDEEDDEEDDDEDDEEDTRWTAMHKLLDAHLLLTQTVTNLVNESVEEDDDEE